MMMWQRVTLCLRLLGSMLRVTRQLVYGAWRVGGLPKPIITIFGSSRLSQDDNYSKEAHVIAQKLIDNDMSVLTGGGPGIMQAAGCNLAPAGKGKGRSMGIGVKDLGERPNTCMEEYFELDHFFARKWLLTRYSVGFIVFPGGFGTFDELSEILTLIQTKRMEPVPIILVGTEYWAPFIAWMCDQVLQRGLIDQENLNLFTVLDDLDRIVNMVCEKCKLPAHGTKIKPTKD